MHIIAMFAITIILCVLLSLFLSSPLLSRSPSLLRCRRFLFVLIAFTWGSPF